MRNKFILLFILISSAASWVEELRHEPKGFSLVKSPLNDPFLAKIYAREGCAMECKQMLVEFDSDKNLLDCVAGRLGHFLLSEGDLNDEREIRNN